jgi:hypothetical protein
MRVVFRGPENADIHTVVSLMSGLACVVSYGEAGIRVFETFTGRLIKHLKGKVKVLISDSKQSFCVGLYGGGVILYKWNIASRNKSTVKLRAISQCILSTTVNVTSLVFSTGVRPAVIGVGNNLHMWRCESGKLMRTSVLCAKMRQCNAMALKGPVVAMVGDDIHLMDMCSDKILPISHISKYFKTEVVATGPCRTFIFGGLGYIAIMTKKDVRIFPLPANVLDVDGKIMSKSVVVTFVAVLKKGKFVYGTASGEVVVIGPDFKVLTATRYRHSVVGFVSGHVLYANGSMHSV